MKAKVYDGKCWKWPLFVSELMELYDGDDDKVDDNNKVPVY